MIAKFDDVTFAYDGEIVLDGASFSIADGECVALTGPNGSGKSTVAELICALLSPDSGRITVMGIDTARIDSDADLMELRGQIGYAFQNPDEQFVEPMVLDEVAFGPSNLGLPANEVLDRVSSALERTGALDLRFRNVNSLSGGEKQRIAVADALALDPRLLILDEPTSMLDEAGRKQLMIAIEDAKSHGMTILLLSHSVEELKLADRILRIEDQHIRESSLDEIVSENERLRATLKKRVTDRRQSTHAGPEDPADSGALDLPVKGTSCSPIIQVEDVSFAYDSTRSRIMEMFAGSESHASSSSAKSSTDTALVLDSVSLDVLPGEVLAIKGPNGCGKSTLLQLMNGLLRPTSGKVLVDGISTSTKSGANAARRIVGLCGQFPERTFFGQTSREEIAFGPKNEGLTADEIESRVQESACAVGIDQRILDASPFELSGGEQRKVALASILALHPRALVLDEPCSGLDAYSHARILESIIDLKAQGTTIVLVSHDDEDIALLADRVFEIESGR